jgi:CheY-like chemotaxis protein
VQTIVICEDNELLRGLAYDVLSPHYSVLTTAEGQEAIDAVRRHRPPLVAVDLALPDMSGLEVVRELRADPELDDTRILVISGYDAETSGEAAVDAGADGFLAKPFRPVELVSRVQELLSAA